MQQIHAIDLRIAGFFRSPVRCVRAARQHGACGGKNPIVGRPPNPRIATEIMVMLEKNDGPVCLFAKNAVDCACRIAEASKLLLKSATTARHACMETSVIGSLRHNLPRHGLRFQANRVDPPVPTHTEHAP